MYISEPSFYLTNMSVFVKLYIYIVLAHDQLKHGRFKMARKVILVSILFVIILCSQLLAINITADIESNCFMDDITIQYMDPFEVKIYFENDDEFDRQYMSMPLTFFLSMTGNIYHFDVGGYGSTGSVELFNGFEPGGFWDDVQLIEFGWDETPPEGICYIANAGTASGFPSGAGPIHGISFHMMIYMMSPIIEYFCIDSTSFGYPYDWIFEEPLPTFGPICWTASDCINRPPELANCPTYPFSVKYGDTISFDFDAEFTLPPDTSIYFCLIQGVGQIDSATGVWTFTPDFSLEGLTFINMIGMGNRYNACNSGFTYCEFAVNVISNCGDVNGDLNYNIFDVTHLISYLYKDGAPPYYHYHADVNGNGYINIFDVTGMIANLYTGGDPLTCKTIRDDFGLFVGNWCMYERYDSLTSQYDTVTISYYGPNSLKYTYGTGIEYESMNIDFDTVRTTGINPERMYIFPLKLDNNWVNPYIGGNSYDSVLEWISMIPPAGYIEDAYRINRHWSFGENGTATQIEWFAPRIGTVEMYLQEYDLIDGWITNESWILIDYFGAK
jgi:hypothetical protein